MKTQSAKAKGRRLQQWVRDQILESFPSLTDADVASTSMGAGGMDVQLSTIARKLFPYAVECKNTEKVNIWNAWNQAEANCPKGMQPMLIVKRNGSFPLAILDAEHFLEISPSIKGVENGVHQQ